MPPNTFRELAKIKRRLDHHEKRIDDIEEATKEDAETLRLQGESVGLLEQLAKVHDARISANALSIRRIRRRIDGRRKK